jgi:hypothetical protein
MISDPELNCIESHYLRQEETDDGTRKKQCEVQSEEHQGVRLDQKWIRTTLHTVVDHRPNAPIWGISCMGWNNESGGLSVDLSGEPYRPQQQQQGQDIDTTWSRSDNACTFVRGRQVPKIDGLPKSNKGLRRISSTQAVCGACDALTGCDPGSVASTTSTLATSACPSTSAVRLSHEPEATEEGARRSSCTRRGPRTAMERLQAIIESAVSHRRSSIGEDQDK